MKHKSRSNKSIYYIMPTSKDAATRARINFWILTIIVGVVVAGGMGVLLYLKDRL